MTHFSSPVPGDCGLDDRAEMERPWGSRTNCPACRNRTAIPETSPKESPVTRDEKLKLCDVLAEIGVSRSSFYRMRAIGKAPKCIKLPNGQLRIRRRDLDAWFTACEEQPEIRC
jgi:predicted DNA-binding transcriptional regulator AlpA